MVETIQWARPIRVMDQAGAVSRQGRGRPGRIRVWIQASRAFTLGMPFMSVTVGSFLAFYAGASFSAIRYLAAVVAAIASRGEHDQRLLRLRQRCRRRQLPVT